MEFKSKSAYFRTRPEEFFDLSSEEQELRLTEICGPIEGYLYTYRRNECSDMTAYDSASENVYDEMDNNAFRHLWKNVGRLMEFFRVEFDQNRLDCFKHELPNEIFDEFMTVFPFGCISHVEEYQYEFSIGNCVTEWILGRPSEHLIRVLMNPYRIKNEMFEQIITVMEKTVYFTDEIIEIRRSIWAHLLTLIDDHKPEIERRRNVIISVMTQKKFEDSNKNTDVYRFIYLTVSENSILRPDLKIPKPRWSRESHGDLTISTFTEESLIVLAMQKFRYSNFTLHKDLVDVVLKHLFELHLRDIENTLDKRDALYAKLNCGMNNQERLKYGLAVGICLDGGFTIAPSSNRELDIVHLHMGLMIDKDDGLRYWTELRQMIYDQSRIKFLGEYVSDVDPYTALDFGRKIIVYCREMNIDLCNVIKGHFTFIFVQREVVNHELLVFDDTI